jgi:hypothetical protein
MAQLHSAAPIDQNRIVTGGKKPEVSTANVEVVRGGRICCDFNNLAGWVTSPVHFPPKGSFQPSCSRAGRTAFRRSAAFRLVPIRAHSDWKSWNPAGRSKAIPTFISLSGN